MIAGGERASHVTLVTGAAGALGLAIVTALLERGGAVVLSDVDQQALETVRLHLQDARDPEMAITTALTQDTRGEPEPWDQE